MILCLTYLLKVGYSLKDPAIRAKELENTGTPTKYIVRYEALVFAPRAVEQQVHRNLAEFNVGKEWFNCSLGDVVEEIYGVVDDPDGILIENFFDPPKSSECPRCSGTSIAEILYGMPNWDLVDNDIKAGNLVLGGCNIDFGPPAWHCNSCQHRWGKIE